MTTSIIVFTRDLRVRDNPALVAASKADTIVPLFVVDDAVIHHAGAAANRFQFLIESLTDLDASLRELGAGLVIRRGDWVAEVVRIAAQCGANAVHCSDDVSAYAQTRLASLRESGLRDGYEVLAHPGITVVPHNTLFTGGGTPYQVFTPFYRRWSSAHWRRLLRAPTALTSHAGIDPGSIPTLASLTSAAPSPKRLSGGERVGLARLRTWADHGLANYPTGHNDVAGDLTSRISAYLHFGCISPLEVATRLQGRVGGAEFVRQLCWRDFFHQLLATKPDLARRDMRHRGVPANSDDEAFDAWCNGQTGYPLVDAGMRQLQREGFMHNRVRMVTASFLTKNLDVAWQLGAAVFMRLLIDGDIANNQLSWQWVAGTGSDSNPHRIFNPTRQSERFDPNGDYIRRYVPELADLDAPMIHNPPAPERERCGYPLRLVDHAEAIAAYRARLAST